MLPVQRGTSVKTHSYYQSLMLLQYVLVARIKSNPKQSIVFIIRLELRYSSHSSLERFQIDFRGQVGSNLFSTNNLFQTGETLPAYRYSYDKCSDDGRLLLPPAHTVTAKTHFATSSRLNLTHSIRIPLVSSPLYFDQHTPARMLPRGTKICKHVLELVYNLVLGEFEF